MKKNSINKNFHNVGSDDIDSNGKKEKETFLCIDEVCEIANISSSSVYRLVGQEKFPKRAKTELRRSLWLESKVYEWIKNINH